MIKIKKAYCEDSHNVSQLLISKYHFKSIEEAREVYNIECSSQHYRLACEGDNIVGLISWKTQGTLDHGVIELTRIAVLKKIKKPLEVKELLFDVMLAEADYYYKQNNSKLRKIFSLIHSDNKHVKDFFENKGMIQEAVLRNHFRKGQDELVFSLFFN